MAIIKCKMCGGDLNIIEGASTAVDPLQASLLKNVSTVEDRKTIDRVTN